MLHHHHFNLVVFALFALFALFGETNRRKTFVSGGNARNKMKKPDMVFNRELSSKLKEFMKEEMFILEILNLKKFL